jgi:hypothetical protein
MNLSLVLEIWVQISVYSNYFFLLFMLEIQIYRILTLKYDLVTHVFITTSNVLDPTRHVAKPLTTLCIGERDHLKMIFKMYWFSSLCLTKTGILPSPKILQPLFLLQPYSCFQFLCTWTTSFKYLLGRYSTKVM